MKVCIIGAGRLGACLMRVLKKRGHRIEIFDTNPSKGLHKKKFEKIIPGQDFLFLCIPSWVTRATLLEAKKYLNKKTIVVSFSKGIEHGTRLTMDRLLRRVLPRGQKYAIFGGAMLAEEIDSGLAGAGVVGVNAAVGRIGIGAQKNVFAKIARLFSGTKINLEFSNDARGVALAGILKNVYAITLGMAHALLWGDNAKGKLAQQCFKEMCAICQMLGGKKETVMGTAGLGDFVASGFSPHSRNRKVGDELVKTGKCCLVSEGFVSFESLVGLVGKTRSAGDKKFPVLSVLEKILLKKQNPKFLERALLNQF